MPITIAPPRLYQRGDIPRPPDMEDYLSHVRAVSSMFGRPTTTIPEDMNHLDFAGANNIELALLEMERAINAMQKSWMVSGEIEAGGS